MNYEEGTPLYQDGAHNNRVGYVIKSLEPNPNLYVIGGGGMQAVQSAAQVVWLNEQETGEAVQEWDGEVLEKAAALAERMEMKPATAEQLQEYIKQSDDKRERMLKHSREQATIRAEERKKFEEVHANTIPSNTKALIVAELIQDQSDLQSDYHGSTTLQTVVLGFSKHTRDLFSEMRKHCVNFEAVHKYATAPGVNKRGEPKTEDNKEYWANSDEHREKYSMGAGYYLKDTYRNSDGWQVRKINIDASNPLRSLATGTEFKLTSTLEPAEHTTSEPAQALTCERATIEEHTHTKKNFQMFIVILKESLDRADFLAMKYECQLVGGWYSRQWGPTPGGFAFKSAEDAQAFVNANLLAEGEEITPAKAQPSNNNVNTHAKPAANTKQAEKFRTLADKMQKDIDHKLADRLTNTPKRQRDAASQRIDGHRLERTQQVLRNLADMHEAGTVPAILQGVRSKKHIFDLMGTVTDSSGYYNIVDTGEQYTKTDEANALWELVKGKTEEEKQAEELREKINSLLFAKIPGYFPTPKAVIDIMLDYARVEDHHKILEPSAGSGAILDELPEACIKHAFEINHTLCEILKLKGYEPEHGDFMKINSIQEYDRVLMNPPFEKLQDIDHVQRAFRRLKKGGRLVAIMSPSPFFNSAKKAENFRSWFDDLGGEMVELPENSFKESGTGVSTRLIILDKD